MVRKNYSQTLVLFRLPLLVLFCSYAGIASGEKAGAGTVPGIKQDCTTCHPDISKGPALQKSLSGLCLDCHPDRTGPNEHRIGIVSPTAPGLPLHNGKITCVTCHDPHSNTYGKMLRLSGKSLCSQCHRY